MYYQKVFQSTILIGLLTLLSVNQSPDTASASKGYDAQMISAIPSAVATAPGGTFTCALTSIGDVKCWGGNYGPAPVYVSGLANSAIAITAGYAHTCALTTTGGVKCWGENYNGQLGNGSFSSSTTPVDVSGLTSGVVAVKAGDSHTCAIVGGGGLKCWGQNFSGQLGNGTTTNSNVPVDVIGLNSGVTKVSPGRDHTCAVVNASAQCWGSNGTGMLGNGNNTDSHTPVNVSGLSSGVTGIVAGVFHSCALNSGGGVKCWGSNGGGLLGDGTTTNRNVPVDVSGLTSGVIDITADWGGWGHTCALTNTNGVKCWGRNKSGQIGDGTTIDRDAPTSVYGLTSGVTGFQSGGDHTCAMVDGNIKCWGWNGNGQLGNGRLPNSLVPTIVTGGNNFTAIAPGLDHTCGLTMGGGVKCWGDNFVAFLDSSTPETNSTPTDVSGLTSGVVAISAGLEHTCAVTIGGGVKCWGANFNGQLGTGNGYIYPAVTDVSGLTSGISAVSAGGFGSHTCALTTGGGVKCWGGYNSNGQLGNGTTTQSFVPVDVVGLGTGITKIAAGGFHVCALTTVGGVKCWGGNFAGQLGDGTTIQRVTPVDVSGLTSGVMAITAGEYHTCVVTNSGGVKCWGDGNHLPVDVNGLASGVTGITSGDSYTCAVTSGGGVKCWGQNDKGQLGDGTQLYRASPAGVYGLTSGVGTIAARYANTCTLTGSSAKCWGANDFGQIGDGVPTYQATPVNVAWVVSSAAATIPTSGGTLNSTADHTSYNFPAGVFTDTVTVTHTVPLPNDVPSTGELIGIGHAFDIYGTYSATGQLAQPTRAYTITIQYTDAEKGPAIGNTLALYWWNGSHWVKDPSSMVDVNANKITAAPNHFSLWAVMGETIKLYLPVTLRN